MPIFAVEAFELFDDGPTAPGAVDITGLAISGGKAVGRGDKVGQVQAQATHRATELVAFAVVAAIAYRRDLADAEGAQIGGDGPGGSGLAAVADHLIASPARL